MRIRWCKSESLLRRVRRNSTNTLARLGLALTRRSCKDDANALPGTAKTHSESSMRPVLPRGTPRAPNPPNSSYYRGLAAAGRGLHPSQSGQSQWQSLCGQCRRVEAAWRCTEPHPPARVRVWRTRDPGGARRPRRAAPHRPARDPRSPLIIPRAEALQLSPASSRLTLHSAGDRKH